jgi:tRNA nucleotidyltransferase (CCA-adding enzyme)
VAIIAEPARGGGTVLARLQELPGGPELLEVAAGADDSAVVGGTTRDLLLGRKPRELDVVVAGDALPFAGELASSLGVVAGGEAGASLGTTLHERFGTATIRWRAGRIDIAARRAESYRAPGALPEVRAGTAEEDLRRRDFTVNAVAVTIGGPSRGELSAVAHALEDLSAARLRVLHERSFVDDPTRLLRLARYLARLGFQPDEHTAELAESALAEGALGTVSGARIGAELRLALDEPDPIAPLIAMSELGVLAALRPGLRLNAHLARIALDVLPGDGRPDLLVLGCLLLSLTGGRSEPPEPRIRGFLDDLEFPAGDRDRALRAVLLAPSLVEQMRACTAPSQLRRAVHAADLETIALAAALADGLARDGAGARRWLESLRHVGLAITGDDLLAAGIPAGPEIGRRLDAALDKRLDGELDDSREAQLRAALEARV